VIGAESAEDPERLATATSAWTPAESVDVSDARLPARFALPIQPPSE
jgi:hypothetical protein